MRLINFGNSRGERIAGLLEEVNPQDKRICIIVHGYSSGKTGGTAKAISSELRKRKLNSLRIDLSGLGESEGDFSRNTLTKWADDVQASISVCRKLGYTTINLFGSSSGSTICAIIALERADINKIALQSFIPDYVEHRADEFGTSFVKEWQMMGWAHLDFSGEFRKHPEEYKEELIHKDKHQDRIIVWYEFMQDAAKWNFYEKGSQIKCDTLIVNGDSDEQIPVERIQRMKEVFPEAQYEIIEGGDHVLEVTGDRSKAMKLFGDFLEK